METIYTTFRRFIDRWKNGENYGFGENSNISSMSYIIGDVKVGKNCYIGPFTILDGSGGLEIGDNTSIAAVYRYILMTQCLEH